MTGPVGSGAEAKVVMVLGAVLLFGGLGCLVVGQALQATQEDPRKAFESSEDPQQVLADFNDRLQMTQRFLDIGGPLALAGAALFVIAAVQPRPDSDGTMRRVLGLAIVVGAALLAMTAGLVITQLAWEDGISTAYRAWGWVKVVAWVALGGGLVAVAMAFRGARPGPDVASQGPEDPTTGSSEVVGR